MTTDEIMVKYDSLLIKLAGALMFFGYSVGVVVEIFSGNPLAVLWLQLASCAGLIVLISHLICAGCFFEAVHQGNEDRADAIKPATKLLEWCLIFDCLAVIILLILV